MIALWIIVQANKYILPRSVLFCQLVSHLANQFFPCTFNQTFVIIQHGHDIKPTLFSLIGEAMIVTSPNHNDVQAKGIGPHVTFGVSANQFEDTKKGFCASNHRQMCSYIIPLLTVIFANVMPYAMSLWYVAVLLGQQQRKQATR